MLSQSDLILHHKLVKGWFGLHTIVNLPKCGRNNSYTKHWCQYLQYYFDALCHQTISIENKPLISGEDCEGFLCIFLPLKICPKLNKLLKKTFQLFEGSTNIQENLLKISFLFQKHPVVVCSYVLLYSRELLGWSIHFLRNAHLVYL